MRPIVSGVMKITLLLALIGSPLPAHANGPTEAVESGAKQYRHKYMFTQKKHSTTNCIRIVATAMKALASYKSCKTPKGTGLTVELASAKCEKDDGTLAYVFETFDDCAKAKADVDTRT